MSQAKIADDVSFWKMVSEDLEVDILSPFEVTFPDDSRLCVAALVKDFGSPRGMLIASDYQALKPYVQKIIEIGHGYSAQLGSTPEGYDRGAMLDVLNDWGWSGDEDKRPSWLK